MVSFCVFPRSEERVQGTVFPVGVWAAAQRNPISKKGDVVSEQNAKHSAIETGSNRKSMSERPNQPQSGSGAKPDGGFPQIFQSGAKDSNSAFFQQYLRKMQLLPLKNPLLDEKDSKSVKKRLKKGLTRGRNRDIITELSARDTNSPDSTDP